LFKISGFYKILVSSAVFNQVNRISDQVKPEEDYSFMLHKFNKPT
jgi:hypothetical protein